jgi:hypothetical protein
LSKKDRFGARRPHDLEISGPIMEIDDFERRRRHLDAAMVSHVLVIRKFGNIGITATQLNLKPGDVVEVLEKYPVGYWRGRHRDREGIFDAECCVPCKPDGEPLESSSLLEPGELREMMVEDAETSESHGGGGDGEEEESKNRLHKAVLKKVSLRRGAGADAANASAESAPVSGENTPRPESEESVSVSIDPHLLDSIGESPRGVMAMIRSRGSNGGTEEGGRRRKSANQQGHNQTNNNSNSNINNVNSSSTWVPGPDVKIVRLNIGGSRFSTTLATLCKYQDSMLAVMFGGRFGPPPLDEEGYYFVDRFCWF